MADYRDVMHARHEADEARANLSRYAGALEDADRTDNGLGNALGLEAVCLELRLLGVIIDYSMCQTVAAVGRV